MTNNQPNSHMSLSTDSEFSDILCDILDAYGQEDNQMI